MQMICPQYAPQPRLGQSGAKVLSRFGGQAGGDRASDSLSLLPVQRDQGAAEAEGDGSVDASLLRFGPQAWLW